MSNTTPKKIARALKMANFAFFESYASSVADSVKYVYLKGSLRYKLICTFECETLARAFYKDATKRGVLTGAYRNDCKVAIYEP
jgi:hypothetical protein